MKIYVVTTGENAITVSLNGEAAVAKTVKPTITALANRNFRFECDGIDEEVESYLNIFINGQPLKGSWLSDEEWLSVALFDAIMNKTFTSGASSPGSSYLVYTALLTQTGTDAPVATVLQNTLGGDVIWTYGGVDGVMVGTATGLLTFHKTVYFSQASNSFRDTLVVIDGEDGNSFQLKTMTNLTPTNGVLYYSTFEIRVYP